MDFSSREILIALGVLVVLGIILDGLRRMRVGRHSKLRSSTRKQPIFDDNSPEESISELPGGGARVVGYRDGETTDQINTDIRSAAESQIHKLTAPFRELEQVPLDLGNSEEQANSSEEYDSEELEYEGEAEEAKPESVDEEPGLAVIFHLMAPTGETFRGRELDDALVAQWVHAGKGNIYHRHEDEEGSGPILFSIANAINPGTFEFDAMDSFVTPGLTFFMVAQDTDRPIWVFDEMLAVAQALEHRLGGELKDDRRSTLTNQTIAHYRQQVVDSTRGLA